MAIWASLPMEDVLLALSYSGETDELITLVPALERFDVKLVAITGNPSHSSPERRHPPRCSCKPGSLPLNLAPTSSSTAMLVLGDALAMVLLEARGFQKEDFARFHPGGRLGRTLLFKVHQIMRGPGPHGPRPPRCSCSRSHSRDGPPPRRRRCHYLPHRRAGWRLYPRRLRPSLPGRSRFNGETGGGPHDPQPRLHRAAINSPPKCCASSSSTPSTISWSSMPRTAPSALSIPRTSPGSGSCNRSVQPLRMEHARLVHALVGVRPEEIPLRLEKVRR